MLENAIWDAYMMILNDVSLYIVLYTIVIYFIKSMSYMSYNRYIVNRR